MFPRKYSKKIFGINLRILLFILLFANFLIASNLYSQFRLDNWRVHTSAYNPIHCDVDANGAIWAATNGGIFYYEPKSDFMRLYNIDVLISLDISVISIQKSTGKVFVGSWSGILSIFNPIDSSWTHNTDIYSSDFQNKEIKNIYFINSEIFVVGGFGLAKYNAEGNVFIENTNKFGNIANSVVTTTAINNEQLWIGGNFGAAQTNINNLLVDPNNWTVYTRANGLPDETVSAFITFNNKIYGVSNNKIFELNDDNFNVEYISDSEINSIGSYNNQLFYSTKDKIFLEGTELTMQHPAPINYVETLKDNENNESLIILYQDNGLGIYKDTLQIILPETPITNLFNRLAVASDGRLWAATSQTGSEARGIMTLKDNVWTNINVANYPEMKTNSYFTISMHPDDRAMASSFGDGFMFVDITDDDEVVIEQLNKSNSCFEGINETSNFIVVGDSEVDSRGTTWVASLGTSGVGPILVSLDKDGNCQTYNNISAPTQRSFLTLAIDFSGTKWIGGYHSDGHGLVYYNDRGTADKSDDISNIITSAQNEGLTSNSTRAIKTDLSGMVWIAMDNGLSVIVNPSTVLSGNEPIIRSIRLLGNKYVNDIMIDPQNNKWVATLEGIWVFNQDASEVIAIINTNNSPLTTNNIKSLALDKATGDVYFGTENGLFIASSFAVEPQKSYDVFCYPQPFVPEKDLEMVIDGLAADSDIRIITMDGQLVRSLSAQGRKTLWDGRNKNGDYVKSGIYLIVVDSGISNAAGVGKIAVINE